MDIDHEISILVAGMKRLGEPNAEGNTVVKFGVIFKDDEMAGKLEALVGTMKAAKKKKIIDFKGEILLQGAHDDVDVILFAGN
mmetsp:Transcript_11300/g.18927  ORF Transcript_11300/g.18927 Transcript_11300/m.18927 type:complete len:83 (-) Transcript_11300:33-281(-)|eukprot:CAMPEP_0168582056 /NCGR_PEP_ID=MMETSP0420-20121227/1762_1 /TAXON_ID=498008 /ORGANISM="Pessonella sp." /LENGTH=82 /DNA_ID=CAMNT_0008616485 /DNA_START=38 /DNA_END=286 /DNA_ORIENTATION=+